MAGWCYRAGGRKAARGSLSEAWSTATPGSNETAAPRRTEDFPPARRLCSPAAFGRVFRSGRRRNDHCFTVIAAPGATPTARLGLAVSRKVSKSAVQRNRIKRLVRETFRKHGSSLPALDIVVMARPGAAACDNGQLTDSIDSLLRKTARQWDASQSS